MLAPDLIMAYHATRLLPHEVDWIRDHGLRPLSADLIADRVAAAHQHDAVTAEQMASLRTANVFHERDADGRAGVVCLFLGRRVLDEDVSAVWPLITTWGGEGIYMSSGGYVQRPMLKTLGGPAIVVAGIDLSAGWRIHGVYPDLLKVFVGNELDLEGNGADVIYGDPVPAAQIIDIWMPGHAEFDRHIELLNAV